MPLIGNGSDASPYRPSLPAGIEKVPGANWSAHIPSKADGSPQYPDAYVCFPEGFKFPPGLTAVPPKDVAEGILKRDPSADLKAMIPPPAVIKGSWQDYRDRIVRAIHESAVRAIHELPLLALAWAASAVDDFNSGTSALSANWSSGYTGESIPTVVSDAAECATGLRCVASYNALVPGSDQYAQGKIMQYQGGVTDGDVGPAVRMAAPSTFSGYFARCGNFSSATVSTILQKRIAGASSSIATETAASAWTLGSTSRLEIIAGTLTVYRNGTPVASGPADSVNLLSGRGGMMINSTNATTSANTSRLDDFEVGDSAAAPSASRRRVVVVQ